MSPAHTPYDGSKQPFTVGLSPLDLADWIEPDARLGAQLAEKERLFAADEAAVFRAEEETVDAQREVLALLLVHLPRRFPHLYANDGDSIRILTTGAVYRPGDWTDAPLKLAARLVQEDLVIMRRSGAKADTAYRLAAAALCFPSSWSLAEKFGQDMPAIHDQVPGFNGARMGRIVARIFETLGADTPVWRLNWSLYGDGELHHPRPKSLDTRVAEGGQELFVRVERQTLRRLPGSGDILFTIRIHHDPLSAFAAHPDGALLATRLRDQLLALDADQLAYKGLTRQRDAIAQRLQHLADTLT